jgi:hypothetical protein
VDGETAGCTPASEGILTIPGAGMGTEMLHRLPSVLWLHTGTPRWKEGTAPGQGFHLAIRCGIAHKEKQSGEQVRMTHPPPVHIRVTHYHGNRGQSCVPSTALLS